MSATNVSLKQVPVADVKDYEHVLIEVLEDHTYNKEQHPGLVQESVPLFFSETPEHEWKLITSDNDVLFREHGWPTHREAICAFLSREGGQRPYQGFHISEYNAQAETPLAAGVDYAAQTTCTIPICQVEGKDYFIVDGFTYHFLVKNPPADSLVNIMIVNGKRIGEIKEECQRMYDETMQQVTRHLSVHCEAGVFVAGRLAQPTLTFVYNIDLDVFELKKASSARLFLMYARDKQFIKDMTPTLVEYHTDLAQVSPLCVHHDNLTIEISAVLLELKFAQREDASTRQNEISLLHKYNLDVLATKNLIKRRTFPFENEAGGIDERELIYLDLSGGQYICHKTLFAKTFGREPQADFYSFADEDITAKALA